MTEPAEIAPRTPEDGVSVEEGTKRGTVTTRVPTKQQTALARRLAEVRATVPTWTASVDVDVEELRLLLPDVAGAPELVDAVVAAAGEALRGHERINGAWRDGMLESWSRANVALAVDAVGGAIALPTMPEADRLTLAELADRRRDVTARAVEGGLRAPDSAGATFAVVDGGPEGPDRFDAIMPPGTGATLAVGAPRRRPWVVADAIVPRHVLSLTLTADHRAIYPGHGGAFLRRVAGLLEDPRPLLGR
ncbi:2-oxo acid dehydrogenase subunit E2 [Patulibacter defluvii]|uniref:2-oxo acid dehydrogenase subunit E2 n=1 Tax=Patulibacter defluvii TaxID=3095358 RepID=UPI002A75CD4A|nr:2-oxo acid dehydrogenase subunit E2 [Patulibacter sp. DM4]